MDLYNEAYEVVRPRDRKTIIYIYPAIYQHDLKGYCDINLAYRCNTYQDILQTEIGFDTRITKRSKRLLKPYLGAYKGRICDTIDQDPLNGCAPVNCDFKYLGYKPFYDKSLKKCVEGATCIGDFEKELPDIVYIPDVNSCRDLDMPMTVQDIYAITTGLGTVTQSTSYDDVSYVEARSNCSTISQNINLLRDLLHGKLCPCSEDKVIDFSGCFRSALFAIILCIISAVAVLFSFICCINVTVKLYKLWSKGELSEIWRNVKSCLKKKKKCKKKVSYVDKEIRNALLKDVIVRDIPIELRESVVNVCDRMGREVGKKKRYRDTDVGSQISLINDKDSVTTTTSSDE
ncbi:unnamed protein product [Colias eurytheme]|nr:unnamed protein product [Colias eurytheme]